jgi:D-arabinose 1-dehydrogenase-like Zn-dependent alcohol dehydrogenase
MGSRTQPPAAWHKLSVRGADHDAAGNCRHSAGIIVLTPALRPKPDPKEALVKVEAVSFNYRDLLILENGLGGGYDLPLLPGSDFAGVASISRYGRNAIRA